MSQPYTLQKPSIEVALEEQIDQLYKRKLARLPVFKDLPRLAGRIHIEKYNDTGIPKTIDEPSKKRKSKALSLRLSEDITTEGKLDEDKIELQDETPASKIWKQVKNVIFTLSEMFDDEETQNKIKQTFNSSEPPSDYQLSLPTLFSSCMNEDTSKVVKVLKLIHQNIIYIGCYELKLRVPYLLANMTKDVRGELGWRIEVFEGKDTVTVTHIRREESLPTAGEKKQFQLEWKLHIVLNKDLSEITFASLKITDLIFPNDVDPQFKQEINRNLCSGNLFIY
ncbi:hypothetical protein DICPUDRAFT_152412 [Dictyostelium purpureum]|uniref:Ras guanine nucleotide exchange factor glfB-like C-terminal domain-containing protein n=1 Tax=Dictyostelium purpureum TaxID=5786 RepID=F0ZLA4_DICPU|nr:uncharacterized protein DICPUDRAFT_152412 [Dictyostelium purpureum]EGC35282.1 hypothetical protein DICPUDRAFT_152412 [Dictyostelium purpureum]|eukprot:XP_003288208.1 hypothetical protein DICPUDRAFT_152412 [Dictyostelium purpureum]